MRSFILMALTILCGCTDFDPRSLLNGPRVIGLVAEPPAVGPSDSFKLTAVEYNPVEVERSWSVCLISGGVFTNFACVSDELVLALPDVDAEIDVDLGPDGLNVLGVLAEFFASEDGQEVASSCGDACTGRDGEQNPYFDLQIALNSTWADGSRLTTYKSVRVHLDDAARNQNPEIADLVIQDKAAGAAVVPGEVLELSVFADLEMLERYVDEGGREYDEELTFTWYASAGEFSNPVTFGADLDTTLTLPDEMDATQLEIFVVARDGRGGADFLKMSVPVEASSP